MKEPEGSSSSPPYSSPFDKGELLSKLEHIDSKRPPVKKNWPSEPEPEPERFFCFRKRLKPKNRGTSDGGTGDGGTGDGGAGGED